jgi:hypothetical protein
MGLGFVGALGVFAALLGLRDPKKLAFLLAALAPWQGLDIDLGLRVTAYRVVAAAFLLVVLPRYAMTGHGRRRSVATTTLALFFLYAVLWTLGQIPFLPDADTSGGSLRGPGLRAAFQCVMLLIDLGPALLLPAVLRTADDVERVGTTYVASVAALALVGWLQLGLWYGAGANPLPIGYVNSLLGGSQEPYQGIDHVGGREVLRMNSLGGEPKGLGQSIAFAMLMLQVFGAVRTRVWLWPLLAASLVATASASGFLVWLSGSLIAAALRSTWGSAGKRGAGGALQLAVALTVGVGLMVAPLIEGLAPTDRSGHIQALSDRVIGRDLVEDFDAAVFAFLQDQPGYALLGVGLGNIHLYAADHLPQYAWRYAGGTAFVAKTGALRLLSEVGMLGLGLFLVAAYRHVAEARRAGPTRVGLDELPLMAIVAVWCFLIRGGYVAPQVFMTLGACAAAASLGGFRPPTGPGGRAATAHRQPLWSPRGRQGR